MSRQLHECGEPLLSWGSKDCTNGDCVYMNVSLDSFEHDPDKLNANEIATGKYCKCEPGWTGLSDWVNADGSDCQIHLKTIFSLWIICLSVYGIAAVWSIPRIIASYQRIVKNRKQAGTVAKGGFFRQLRKNGSFIMCFVHLLITTPAAFGLGLVEILTYQRIGVDWTPTILFLLWRTSFYACSVVFQPYMLSTIVGKIGKESRDAVRDFSKKSNYLTLATWVIGFFVLGSMFARNPTSQVATFATYTICVAVVQSGFFWQAKFTRDKISAILDKSYESVKKEEILEVKAKLVRMQGSVMKQTSMLGVLNLTYGVIPFFWNKFPYFIPVTVLLPGLLFVNAVRTLAQDSKKNTSNNSSMGDFKRRFTKFGQGRRNTTDDDATEKKPKLKLQLDAIKDEAAQSSMNYTSDGTPMEGTQVPYVHGLELSFAQLTSIPTPTEEKQALKENGNAKANNRQSEQIEHKTYLPSPSRILAKLSAMTTPSKKGFSVEQESLNETDGDESHNIKSTAVDSDKHDA